MSLRWLDKNGEKVLQRVWTNCDGHEIYEDIPVVKEPEKTVTINKEEFVNAYYRWRKSNSWDYDCLAKELGF